MSVDIICENIETKNLQTNFNNQSLTKLDQSIQNIIKNEGFTKYDLEKKCVSTSGGNYLGVLYEIDVKGDTKDGEKELNIFVKNIIPGESNMKILTVSDVYKAEIYVYKELSKLYHELQEDYNVPLEERYRFVKVYDESNTEVILMENLAKKGYTTCHRMDVISLEFAEIAIRKLAKFHGLSFVLKTKRPDYFETKIKTMNYPLHLGQDWKDFIKSSEKICMDNIDKDLQITVEKIFENVQKKHEQYFFGKTNNICLCHGDYRPNNIMAFFKDGVATDLIPVDYQIIYYGCPLADFFYFIFLSTDRKFRKANLSHLKELYYNTLDKFLKHFNISVGLVFPKEKFEEMYASWLEFGLILGVLYLPFMFASENDVPDLTSDMSNLSYQVDEKYKDRIRGVLEDFKEWGYL